MYLTTVFKKEERNGRKARARRKKRPHRLMHRAQRSSRLGGKGALGPGTRKPQGRPRRRAALRRLAPSSKPSTRDSWQPPARGGQRHPPQELHPGATPAPSTEHPHTSAPHLLPSTPGHQDSSRPSRVQKTTPTRGCPCITIFKTCILIIRKA